MWEIFEKLLHEKGITAYKVSKETNIGRSTFTDWKNGRSVPGTDKLIKIAEFLNVSVEYLKTGKESDKQDIPPLMPEQFELLELYSKLKDEQKTAIMNLLRSFNV